VELPYLLRTIPNKVIMGGDFNCTLSPADSTGKMIFSRALQELVGGLDLVDTWRVDPLNCGYTHYTGVGASRIDRIYITRNLLSNKRGIETVASAMSDHLAVVLSVLWDLPVRQRGRGYWKMNVALLNEESTRKDIRTEWKR